MIEERWNLEELEPGDALDRRVRRRMRVFTKTAPRKAAPFLPFERAVYAVVLAVYALYSGARAVRVFQESRAPQVLARASRSGETSEVSPRLRSPRPCEPASSWVRPRRWWT
jgi:hypothetical protein